MHDGLFFPRHFDSLELKCHNSVHHVSEHVFTMCPVYTGDVRGGLQFAIMSKNVLNRVP
jgi:hypothetical protein